MFWNKLRCLLLSLLLVVTGIAVAEETAPDFSLRDLSGKQVVLSEHRGKVIFLDFWASWCPPCRNSIPAVEQLYDKFKDERVMILGVNVENDPSAAKRFASSKGIRYPVLIGDQKTARAYKVSGIPAFFIIDAEGKIVQRYTGYQPGMSDEWAQTIERLLAKMKPAARPKTPASAK